MLRHPRGLQRSAKLFFVLGCVCSVATIAIACAEPMAPIPVGAIAWNPPARFALWWKMTESCSGRQGDLRAIRWYVVPNATSIDVDGQQVHGETIGNRIVLADSHRLDGPLVRHEMLHALLGVGGHPRNAFLVACNDIVACEDACEAEAGGRPAPLATATELAPGDLVTRVEVVPGTPAASQDSGAVAVIVSITNPHATPAWVRLVPPNSPEGIGYTFGLAIDYDDVGRVFISDRRGIVGTRLPLGANETRRYVWDGVLPPGAYGVRGWFNNDTVPRFVMRVAL